MARESLIPGRVKNTGIDLLIAAVLFGGAIILVQKGNSKFNILGKFVQGSTSLGSAIGQAVGSGIASIPTGVGQGAVSVFSPTGTQNTALRNSLGLPADTANCLTIPFTNIPLPGQNCTKDVTNITNGLPASSPGEPNKLSTSNSTGSVSVDNTRSTVRTPSVQQAQPGSNLTQSTVLINLSTSQVAKDAYNNFVKGLTPLGGAGFTGQAVVGNYIVPGGTIEPLTQNSVDYYRTKGIRITQV